jgi:hypothetical protein
MKSFATLLFLGLTVTAATPAIVMAELPKDPGREVIDLKMGKMVLPFKHWKHQKDLKNECFHCHSKKIGQIEGWSKDTAHTICIPCHELDNKGPVECAQCHKKK